MCAIRKMRTVPQPVLRTWTLKEQGLLLTGKGFFTVVGPVGPGADSDTVTLTVK